jgi:hypothetical protein
MFVSHQSVTKCALCEEKYKYLDVSRLPLDVSQTVHVFFTTCVFVCNPTITRVTLHEEGGPGSSVGKRLTTGWTVWGSNPDGGEIFRTCPDGPWGPPSLLYNGYRFFPGGRERPGLTTHLLLVPWSWKSRAIPVPTLWVTPGL